MTQNSVLAIVLAAGKGTRMKSDIPKVMHQIAGAPMLVHVLNAAKGAAAGEICVVVGPGMDEVASAAKGAGANLPVFVQAEQRGTADAVKAAQGAFAGFAGPVIILYGDTPLLRAETIGRLGRALADGADVVVVGFEADDPTGYGRLLLDASGTLIGIREEKDASPPETAITLCNSGIMGFGSGKTLADLLARIGNANAKGEFYLTDAIALAHSDRLDTRMLPGDADEVLGVNSRAGLAQAEAAMQQRLREKVMAEGATLVAPETVFLSHDTRIGKDVLIEPNVIIGPSVVIEDGATIRGFCHFVDAHIGPKAEIGPFARLRPGADLGPSTKVGNFVEIKNSEIADGAKVPHLTYVGDSSVGARANIGAGTITCNYDGVAKHRTEIGAGAFIGSNSSLVAPVKIGEGAYVGSGSVITKDVSADALAVTRAPQEERPGWAARFRKRRDGK
ncbi:MAG TPA: bifunctional UDP-N-acetylglucosamine diphosphorylase/glucosamine-1-phosphate N-acetyltransferase GlmU [Methyloceanibacter sp.]|nr:bifunctional UDP-N-acetylglucosamine diphosphorylase/glucosamine-1-phosphate N-acetyltransferase GlmU [Methyloceanibacter sp.]